MPAPEVRRSALSFSKSWSLAGHRDWARTSRSPLVTASNMLTYTSTVVFTSGGICCCAITTLEILTAAPMPSQPVLGLASRA